MLKIDAKKTKGYRYNDWLEYFSQIPAAQMLDTQDKLKDMLPAEGYAAAMRWLEIFENPSRMDKLLQGRIKVQEEASIMEVAIGDDDEKFYMSLIRKNVAELDGASPQEVARISQNLNIYRKQLQEIRSRKPKGGTVLAKVLKELSETQPAVSRSSNKPRARKTTKKTTKTVKKSAQNVNPTKKRASKTAPKARNNVKTISKSSGEQNA